MSYLTLYIWRQQGNNPHHILRSYVTFDPQGGYGARLGFYFFSNLAYSVYTLSWVCSVYRVSQSHLQFVLQDFLMDWSIFQTHARYPFLRKELVYRVPVGPDRLIIYSRLIFLL
jgi:hypothetical protein